MGDITKKAKWIIAAAGGVIFITAVILSGKNGVEKPTCSIFDLTLSYTSGEVRQFKRDDFYMGYTGGNSITVSSLPKGNLCYDGTPVSEGFSFYADKAMFLTYTPAEEKEDEFSLTVGGKRAKITLKSCPGGNSAPISANASGEALCGIPLREMLYSYDNDGDNVVVDVYKKPRFGTLSFSGTRYTYTPYPTAAGEDSFTYSLRDEYGNYSKEYTCNIAIDGINRDEIYDDMDKSAGYTAAIMLTRKGMISGETLGELRLFHPSWTVGAGELLVMLDRSAGSGEINPCIDTGLITDGDTENYYKPYIKAALADGIISSYDPNDILTKEEAYRITAEYLNLSDDVKYGGEYLSSENTHREYIPYFGKLYAKGIIKEADLYNGKDEFTKSDLARLIYGIIKSRG